MAVVIQKSKVSAPRDVKAIGVQLPFTEGAVFSSTFTTNAAALTNLRNLLLTIKGERLYQPKFGTSLNTLVFENDSEFLKERVLTEITEAVSIWLPYIDIVDLTIRTVDVRYTDRVSRGISVSITVAVNSEVITEPISFIVTNSGIINSTTS